MWLLLLGNLPLQLEGENSDGNHKLRGGGLDKTLKLQANLMQHKFTLLTIYIYLQCAQQAQTVLKKEEKDKKKKEDSNKHIYTHQMPLAHTGHKPVSISV